MKVTVRHKDFGQIRYDGTTVRVHHDSLSKTIQRLLEPDAYVREHVVEFGNYASGGVMRFMAVLKHLGLMEGLTEFWVNETAPGPPRHPGFIGVRAIPSTRQP